MEDKKKFFQDKLGYKESFAKEADEEQEQEAEENNDLELKDDEYERVKEDLGFGD